MADITFRAKVETAHYADDSKAYDYVRVPAIKRSHCDMAAFRSHPKFGSYANSDLFQNLLARQFKLAGIGSVIKLGEEPAGVSIDTSGFLASVTITL